MRADVQKSLNTSLSSKILTLHNGKLTDAALEEVWQLMPMDLKKISLLRENEDFQEGFTRLPVTSQQFPQVTSLNLSGYAYSGYTDRRLVNIDGISCFPALEVLKLNDNKNFSRLPEALFQLQSLRALSIKGTKISQLPAAIGDLTNLETLDLSDTQITQLPETLKNLTHLSSLILPKSFGKQDFTTRHMVERFLNNHKQFIVPAPTMLTIKSDDMSDTARKHFNLLELAAKEGQTNIIHTLQQQLDQQLHSWKDGTLKAYLGDENSQDESIVILFGAFVSTFNTSLNDVYFYNGFKDSQKLNVAERTILQEGIKKLNAAKSKIESLCGKGLQPTQWQDIVEETIVKGYFANTTTVKYIGGGRQ